MPEYVIEARNLCKTFAGGVVAVNALDLKVERGSVCGLIGRNGAGKTTFIRMLMGLLHPNSGTARILDMDMWNAPRAARARVGYVSQSQRLHGWMTTGELCIYASHFYETWDKEYARSLARQFGVAWDRQVDVMSGGEQRKVAIVLAMAHRPQVLLMDEPAAGLDPISRRELIDALIDALANEPGTTLLFSTHIISDLERIADTVAIMDRGQVAAASRLDELQTRTKKVQVIFEGAQPPANFRIPGALRSETSGPVITAIARLESDTQLDELRRISGARVNVFPLGLEETYIELFGSQDNGDTGEASQSVGVQHYGGAGRVVLVLLVVTFAVLAVLAFFLSAA